MPGIFHRSRQAGSDVVDEDQRKLVGAVAPQLYDACDDHFADAPVKGVPPRPMTMPGLRITTGRPSVRCISVSTCLTAALARA